MQENELEDSSALKQPSPKAAYTKGLAISPAAGQN